MCFALLLLSHGTGASLLENFLFHIFPIPFKENSVKPIAFLANLKIIVSVSAIEKKIRQITPQVNFNLKIITYSIRIQDIKTHLSVFHSSYPTIMIRIILLPQFFYSWDLQLYNFFYSKYQKDYNVYKKYIFLIMGFLKAKGGGLTSVVQNYFAILLY